MAVSVFELFKIGIGPSSSHTVGPMLAAHTFIQRLQNSNLLTQVGSLEVTLLARWPTPAVVMVRIKLCCWACPVKNLTWSIPTKSTL